MTHHQEHLLERQIQKARPSLRIVSPLAYHIVLIFAIFNILLGISLLLSIDAERFSSPLLIINKIFTFKIWGFIFIFVGLVKLYALANNDWGLTRKTLLMGVALKAAWAIALVARLIFFPSTIFITLTWLTLAFIQIVTYIYFLPPSTGSYKQLRKDRAKDEFQ